MDKQLKDHFLSQQLTTSSTDINMLQTHFNEKISAAYIDFMKTYGDVIFEAPLPNSVLVNIANKKLIASMVGFVAPGHIYQVYQELRETTSYSDEPQIKATMLPIIELVDMDEGDYIVLDLSNGSVWVTVFDYSVSSEIKSYGFIANNFDHFLELIQTQEQLENQLGNQTDSVLLEVRNLVIES